MNLGRSSARSCSSRSVSCPLLLTPNGAAAAAALGGRAAALVPLATQGALPRRRRGCLARSRAASPAHRGGSRVVVARSVPCRLPSVLLPPVLRVPSAGQCRVRVVCRLSGGVPVLRLRCTGTYPYPYRYGYGYPYPYPYSSYPTPYPYTYSGSAYPYPDFRPSANQSSTVDLSEQAPPRRLLRVRSSGARESTTGFRAGSASTLRRTTRRCTSKVSTSAS